MTRIARDSTVITDIPLARLSVAMLYGNGRYAASPAAARARFGAIPIAWGDVLGNDPHADWYDVENGDIPVSATPDICRAHNAVRSDYPAIFYVDRANLTPLFNELLPAGLHIVRDFRLIIATLDGTKAVADMTGVTAVQAFGQAQTGGHYDQSIVYDDQWHAAAPPPPPWQAQALKDAQALVGVLAAHQ